MHILQNDKEYIPTKTKFYACKTTTMPCAISLTFYLLEGLYKLKLLSKQP